MANINTTTRQAQLDAVTKRGVSPSYRPLQQPLRRAKVQHTFDATPSANDDLVIGVLGVRSAELIPELCRVASLAGAVQGVVRLEKVAEDGTVTALTGDATLNDNNVAFARATGNATTAVASGEYLQLTIPTVTAIVATDQIQIDLVYSSEDAS